MVKPGNADLCHGNSQLSVWIKRCRSAGFTNFSARASVNAVPFFATLGYAITSHGVRPLCGGIDVPVAFMRKAAGAQGDGW